MPLGTWPEDVGRHSQPQVTGRHECESEDKNRGGGDCRRAVGCMQLVFSRPWVSSSRPANPRLTSPLNSRCSAVWYLLHLRMAASCCSWAVLSASWKAHALRTCSQFACVTALMLQAYTRCQAITAAALTSLHKRLQVRARAWQLSKEAAWMIRCARLSSKLSKLRDAAGMVVPIADPGPPS